MPTTRAVLRLFFALAGSLAWSQAVSAEPCCSGPHEGYTFEIPATVLWSVTARAYRPLAGDEGPLATQTIVILSETLTEERPLA